MLIWYRDDIQRQFHDTERLLFGSYEKRKHFAKVHMKNAIVVVRHLCYVPAVFAHKHSLKKRFNGKIDDCVHFSPLPFCQR